MQILNAVISDRTGNRVSDQTAERCQPKKNIYHDVVLRTNVEKIDSGDRTGGWG